MRIHPSVGQLTQQFFLYIKIRLLAIANTWRPLLLCVMIALLLLTSININRSVDNVNFHLLCNFTVPYHYENELGRQQYGQLTEPTYEFAIHLGMLIATQETGYRA